MTTESGLHYQLQQPLFTEGPSHLTNKQSKYSLTGSLPALHPNTHQASPAMTDTTLMGVLVERWAHIILLGISSWHTEPRQSIHTAQRTASAIYTSAVHLNRERKGERQRLIRTARLSACVHEDTKDSREGVSGSWKAQPRVSKGACNWERKYWPQQHKEWPAWAASPAGKLLCNRVLCCNSIRVFKTQINYVTGMQNTNIILNSFHVAGEHLNTNFVQGYISHLTTFMLLTGRYMWTAFVRQVACNQKKTKKQTAFQHLTDKTLEN